MISGEHLEELRIAKGKLSNQSFAINAINFVGRPIDDIINKLPVRYQDKINNAVSVSLKKAIEIVNITIPKRKNFLSSGGLNRASVIISGGVGGFFGIAGLPLELPVSTGIMLRAIINKAVENGIDVRTPQGKLDCMEVLAFGGGSRIRHTDNSYYYIRTILTTAFEESSKYIASRGFIEEGAPPIVRLLAQIASRFGVTVTDKIALEAIPFIGAVTGASINLIFINHFIRMAEGHFTVRRLESIYGLETVRDIYNSLE
jgi:hypothetical protein